MGHEKKAEVARRLMMITRTLKKFLGRPNIMNRAVYSYRFVPSGTTLSGTLDVPRSVCQMNGAPQSGAEWCTTAYESLRV